MQRHASDGATEFRFSRMCPEVRGSQLKDSTIRQLAIVMAEGGGGQSQVPAGFTYLGQFVAHDMSFEAPDPSPDAIPSPDLLVQLRSPSLDLDSLYGLGPEDHASERFYAPDRIHLNIGSTIATDGVPALNGFDLPRGDGVEIEERRQAIIPDKRNDENLAVAQTHVAFIRFHNRIVDELPDSVADPFGRARELVTKHYQWMVRTDFLPRVCEPSILDDVFDNGRKAFEVDVEPTDPPTMPFEFSMAAFRFGHSMLRTNYSWNTHFEDGAMGLPKLFRFSAKSGDLGGGVRLPSTAIADFRRMYDFPGRSGIAIEDQKVNHAMLINTSLIGRVANLPSAAFERPKVVEPGDPIANLAFHDLKRAKRRNLATGQQMAEFLDDQGVRLTPLSERDILKGRNGGARLGRLSRADREAVATRTPLWFYILREAELHGGVLNGVGAQIVAETFHRAIQGSRESIVRDTAWRPTLGPDGSTFRMADLLLHAYDDGKTLAPPA